MPMHRIYTPSGTYSAEEKSELSKAITALYSNAGLPPFYVLVFFIDLPQDSFYVGGGQRGSFARFNVQHLARHFDAKDQKLGFMKAYENALKPFTADKGLDWEVNVDEADPIYWHENGLSPPAPESEAEKTWFKANKATPFDGPSFASIF